MTQTDIAVPIMATILLLVSREDVMGLFVVRPELRRLGRVATANRYPKQAVANGKGEGTQRRALSANAAGPMTSMS